MVLMPERAQGTWGWARTKRRASAGFAIGSVRFGLVWCGVGGMLGGVEHEVVLGMFLRGEAGAT